MGADYSINDHQCMKEPSGILLGIMSVKKGLARVENVGTSQFRVSACRLYGFGAAKLRRSQSGDEALNFHAYREQSVIPNPLRIKLYRAQRQASYLSGLAKTPTGSKCFNM